MGDELSDVDLSSSTRWLSRSREVSKLLLPDLGEVAVLMYTSWEFSVTLAHRNALIVEEAV